MNVQLGVVSLQEIALALWKFGYIDDPDLWLGSSYVHLDILTQVAVIKSQDVGKIV